MESTTEKLASALAEQHLPDELIERARAGEFDDFKSPHIAPQHALIDELQKVEYQGDLYERIARGEFDGTAEESKSWIESEDGQAALGDLLSSPATSERVDDPNEEMENARAFFSTLNGLILLRAWDSLVTAASPSGHPEDLEKVIILRLEGRHNKSPDVNAYGFLISPEDGLALAKLLVEQVEILRKSGPVDEWNRL